MYVIYGILPDAVAAGAAGKWNLIGTFTNLRASTAGWSPAALAQILKGYGFSRKKEARHGTFFEHPSYPEWATVIIPRHQKLRNWVARDVL